MSRVERIELVKAWEEVLKYRSTVLNKIIFAKSHFSNN